MKQLLNVAKNNEFLRSNAIFFVGSILIAVLNYLYYPILGRLLPVESFGELQVLISLYTQITIFLVVATLVVTNIVVNEKNKDASNSTTYELERLSVYIGIGFLVVISLLAVPLQNLLKFSSPLPFILVGLLFVFSIPLAFRGAYLRGKQDFLGASISGATASAV